MRLICIAMLLVLPGCARPAASMPEDDLATCDGSKAQRFAGRAASAALGEEVLRATGAKVIRWTRPGQAVTMDYRTDRVNIDLDAKDRVVRVTCG